MFPAAKWAMRSPSILITPEALAIDVMDRGDADFARLHAPHQAKASLSPAQKST
jgi:hypothetical protein